MIRTNIHKFLIGAFILFISAQVAQALTNDVSMEGHLEIVRKEGNVWITDPNIPDDFTLGGPVTIGLASEQGGQLLDYGCNYKQLLDNNVNNVNTHLAGGFFRIDLRPLAQYKREFFNVKYIPAGSLTEETIYSVSTTGDMSMVGYVKATTFESSIPLGTPPMTVVSTTTCTNLNADMVDGYHASAFAGFGVLSGITVLTTASSSPYTVPTGVTDIEVILVGGGGGGGGGQATNGTSSVGGGGGGGAMTIKRIAVSGGSTHTFLVGSGGAGVSNGAGNPGAATTFEGTTYSANGGSGGTNMGAAATLLTIAGGIGGAAGATGDVNVAGGAGEFGIRLSATQGRSGMGGASSLGGNSVGVIVPAATGSTTGTTGGQYGGGGAGGSAMRTTGGTTNVAGGNGANGVIIIREYK